MPNVTTPAETTVNRQYKSTVFTMLFNEKARLLELYNAISGTCHTDPEQLQIVTLNNAIYMGIKNDLSFIFIEISLNLYEHQSTVNPNMPLRDLLYVADQYSKLTNDKNIYGRKPIRIPAPHFYVFYNGVEEQPDHRIFRLSEMYYEKEEHPSLELEVTVLNINKGHNSELMNACKSLKDYTEYTDRIRNYAREMPLNSAVEKAVTECIREGILADFLSQNRAEAMKVSIYEYDAEKHLRMEKEDSYNDGYNDGKNDGYNDGRNDGYKDGKNDGYKDGRNDGYKDGKNDGYKDGKNEGKIEILMQLISNMLKRNKTIPQIIDDLGLDESEILEVIKQMN